VSLLNGDLSSLARELASSDRIALDAEGDSYYRYRGRLCTLQLAHERPFVIDALDADLSLLAPILGEDGPIKIVHDASFDARMLAARGVPLGRVFDTSIAARFLGETATGLASLLGRYLGITLDKNSQLSDWGRRPIAQKDLDYLIADVVHLVPLAERLEAGLREHDLLEEAEEESRYLLDRALDPEPVRAPWTRIKGARDLRPEVLARLAALTEVRERIAEARDVPPFRIAANGLLVEAAIRGWTRIRGLPEADVVEAFEIAAERGPPPIDEPDIPPAAERARVRHREKALTAWRAAEAKARDLNEQAILPGHCLRDLARLERGEHVSHVEGLGEKRIDRYGAALMALLAS
jgi:ribonuclease D